MAHKRMFSKDITESDAFADMPLSSQALYFHLGMSADDDGFINNPKRVQRSIGASTDDLNLLLGKRFLIPFESGVVVIKHWRINNTVRSDRYCPTTYQEEYAQLEMKENKAYTMKNEPVDLLVYQTDTTGIPNGSNLDTQNRIEEDRIVENRRDTLSGKPDRSSQIAEIVDYLNSSTGSRYKPTTAKTKSCINARFNEGFTVDDFKLVIDKKVSSWMGDEKMAKYLRPETLFGNKFEGYLNEPSVRKKTLKEVANAKYAEFNRG